MKIFQEPWGVKEDEVSSWYVVVGERSLYTSAQYANVEPTNETPTKNPQKC